MNLTRPTFLLTLAALVLAIPARAQMPASQNPALLEAEKSRGVFSSKTGVKWIVSVSSRTSAETKKAKFSVVSQEGNARADILEPADASDRCYVVNHTGMWFYKKSLSRPVSVSRRQRLSGDAAIGDIATNSLIDGYKIASQEKGTLNGKECDIFNLESSDRTATYAKVKYWVTKGDHLGLQAEYYASSGTLLRTATMSYGNSVTIDGKTRAFLSKQLIGEANRTRYVTLQFTNVQIGTFPDSMFDPKQLK